MLNSESFPMTQRLFPLLCSVLMILLSSSHSMGQDTWTKKADFPSSSRNHGLGFAIGKKGYYGFGQKQTKPFVYKTYQDLWEYDPEANTWTQKADFPGPGRLMTKGFLVNNKIFAGFGYVIAANGPNAGANDYQTDLYEFDPGTNTWIKKNNALLGRGDLFFVINDIMHSVNPEFRAVNKYSASTDTWFETKWEKSEIAPSSSDMGGDNINFSCNKKEYIITTAWNKNKIVNQLWELDPYNIVWRRKNDLPGTGSDTLHVFRAMEKNFLIRGSSELLEYDPAADSWVPRKNIPPEHKDIYPVFSIGERCYGFSKFEFWEFIP